MTQLIKFTLGASELNFTVNPSYPLTTEIEKIQSVDRTASGNIRGENYGVTLRRFPLNWNNMPPSDYSALETWFDSTADGIANSFTYTDINGTNYTVRFTTKTLSFALNSTGNYTGGITLEEE